MKRKMFFTLSSVMMIMAVSFSSCKKDDDNNESNSMLSYSQEDNQVSGYFDEVVNESDEIAFTQTSKATRVKVKVTDNGSNGTRTRTTYFMDNERIDTIVYSNFVNKKSPNLEKNGMIVVEQTGGPMQDTFVRNITLVNFSINGNKIEGTKVITKTGTYTYTVALTNGKVTFNDGTTYTRTFTHTRTWITGFDTPYNIWDDEYTLEGTAQGINRHGLPYTHTITSPLRMQTTCRFIVSGSIDFTVGGNTLTLNYGDENSTCDAKATVTYKGIEYQITLWNK
jgi:hypothetical protein